MSSSFGKTAVSVAVLAGSLLIATGAFAKNDDGIRPGWGFGDSNHTHIGPPGQSVFPFEEFSQRNNSVIFASSNTGGNVIQNHGGGIIALVTGTASTVVSFISSMGQNIFGS